VTTEPDSDSDGCRAHHNNGNKAQRELGCTDPIPHAVRRSPLIANAAVLFIVAALFLGSAGVGATESDHGRIGDTYEASGAIKQRERP
jgi:hypothetical protein